MRQTWRESLYACIGEDVISGKDLHKKEIYHCLTICWYRVTLGGLKLASTARPTRLLSPTASERVVVIIAASRLSYWPIRPHSAAAKIQHFVYISRHTNCPDYHSIWQSLTSKTTEKEHAVLQYSYLSALRAAKNRVAARLPETARGASVTLVLRQLCVRIFCAFSFLPCRMYESLETGST